MTPVNYSGKAEASVTLAPNKNEPDIYNDTILVIHKTALGEKRLLALLGTVDPGKYYTTTDPNPLGAAHLTFGQHLYKMGTHKGHPDIGECVYEGIFGVNVHAGGKTQYVGQWSAGCINIAGGFDGKPYQQFLALAYTHVEHKANIRVNVWRSSDLVKFLASGWTVKPTLLLGIQNQWVAEMQRLLVAKGYPLTVDGDWGAGTTKVVVQFQKDKKLTADGWCGASTWGALS
jgi:hypothetical protein